MSSSELIFTKFSVKHLPLLIFIYFQFSTALAIAYTQCYLLAFFILFLITLKLDYQEVFRDQSFFSFV